MYATAFGLKSEPFRMTPDPECVYMSNSHREVLAGLTYAIVSQKGFVLLTGEAGSGKTTSIARCLRRLPEGRIKVSAVVIPTLHSEDFLELVLLNFGFTQVPRGKAMRLHVLREFLLKADEKGEVPVLIIDEAQKLNAEVLEEIRLLGNFETPRKKLIQIVLAGQPEISELLDLPELRQLKQRFGVRLHLQLLSAQDTRDYIQFRWRMAGGDAAPFTADALAAIERLSNGVPRIINALCDNALILAVAEAQKQVTATHIWNAAADLHLGEPGTGSAQPAAAPPAPAVTANGHGSTPAIAAPPFATFKALERYQNGGSNRPSRWMRWASKFGLAS